MIREGRREGRKEGGAEIVGITAMKRNLTFFSCFVII